jgi:peptidoglycan/LPS O-acetylase OafA/YrhL
VCSFKAGMVNIFATWYEIYIQNYLLTRGNTSHNFFFFLVGYLMVLHYRDCVVLDFRMIEE